MTLTLMMMKCATTAASSSSMSRTSCRSILTAGGRASCAFISSTSNTNTNSRQRFSSNTARFWSPDSPNDGSDMLQKSTNNFKKEKQSSTGSSNSFSAFAAPPPPKDKVTLSQEEQQTIISKATSTNDFYASSDLYPDFQSIGVQSDILLNRLSSYFQSRDVVQPSAVQAASYTAIQQGNDVTIGAETGSGKTLAYLLPILDDILLTKQRIAQQQEEEQFGLGYDYARAIILVPNKELANQALRMATHLCGGAQSIIWGQGGSSGGNGDFTTSSPSSTNDVIPSEHIIRLGILPGGLHSPEDYQPFRKRLTEPQSNEPLDILITTPASLGPLALSPKNIDLFADVETLVIDEADMLFDGGYLRPLENVLMGFRRADKLTSQYNNKNDGDNNNDDDDDSGFGVKKTQHVLVAATLPDMGLKSVEAYVQKKFPYATRVTMNGMHNARHYGLKDQTIWIEDNYDFFEGGDGGGEDEVMHWKKKRMENLINILKTDTTKTISLSSSGEESYGLKGEKVMVFLNSVGDVDSAANALRRAGIKAVPFHAKIPLGDRTKLLNSFRNFKPTDDEDGDDHDEGGEEQQYNEDTSNVLVCTDLAARGLDVPGVTAVVQLQFAGNVVAHLHRMGRCGRAGNRNGRGVIFYGGPESELISVVRDAEMQQERMVLEGNEIIDEDDVNNGGKVQDAFSRKRGFTKKLKKIRRKSRDDAYGY